MKPNKFLTKLSALTIVGIALLELNQSANANIILDFDGSIKLKRKGDSEFQLADYLDTLSYEDEFQVSANSWVEIRCSNTDKSRIKQPGTYQVSKYCPSGVLTKVINNNNGFRPPTEDLTQTPYIVSPRNSSIFNEPIKIKWNSVSEANNYTVQVGEWETETTNTEVVYTGQPLTPGYYSASVETDNGESSGDVGFIVIDDTQAHQVREGAEKIRLEGLDKEAEAFILARFYRNNDLKMLAIEVLEDLVRSGSQPKNVYLLLADIYKEVGLKSEAYELSQQALELENN